MAKLCLDNNLIGTEKHLLAEDGSFWWSEHVPVRAWHLSGDYKSTSDRCLDTAIKLACLSVQTSPPDKFVKAMSVLTGSTGHVQIPWQKVMPKREHQNFIKNLLASAVEVMVPAVLDYYKGTWVHGNHVLQALQPALIDATLWRDLIVEGEGNVPALKSFEPNQLGFAKVPVYNRLKTLTGRLVVDSGPQILTLKREHRSILKSMYGDQGGIYALDFASLEARILLYEHGGKCDQSDLYGMIARDLGYERNAIKSAIISELYGGSKYVLSSQLGIQGKQLDTFVRNVKAYFDTKKLLERVKQQFVTTGKVINRYGRPVIIDEPIDHILINYYGQSTGVDVTMLGFKQVIDVLAKTASRVRPLFMLHDAMLLDVHNDDIKSVEDITHVKVRGYVQKFPFKLERIS